MRTKHLIPRRQIFVFKLSKKSSVVLKIKLYLAKGADEVWIAHENGRVDTFTHTGEVQQSSIAPTAQTVKT